MASRHVLAGQMQETIERQMEEQGIGVLEWCKRNNVGYTSIRRAMVSGRIGQKLLNKLRPIIGDDWTFKTYDEKYHKQSVQTYTREGLEKFLAEQGVEK